MTAPRNGARSAARVLYGALLAMVVLAPLPLGANRPWAWSLMAAWVGLMLLGWGGMVLAGRVRGAVPLSRLAPMAVPFALACCWALVQVLVPGSAGHPLWAEAERALAQDGAGPAVISVSPAASLTALMRLACYGGTFWLAVQLGRNRSRARRGLMAVAVAGTVYAAYGLAVYLSGNGSVLWFPKWAYDTDLTATFVNRNAYGAYAGVGILCCMARLIHTMRLGSPRFGTREAVEGILTRGFPWTIGLILLSMALMFSHSRGALLSTGAGIMALLAALALGRVAPPRRMAVLAGAVAGAGAVLALFGGEATINRMSDISNTVDDRPALYQLVVGAIAGAPLAGHGLGTFETAFTVYRDATLFAPVVYNYAHNVWLEAAMDLGIPGAILLIAAPLAATATCLLGVRRRRRDRSYPAVAVGAAVLLGTHGLVDFSVQIPAIATTFAFLLGLGVSQSWNTEAEGDENPAETAETPVPLS